MRLVGPGKDMVFAEIGLAAFCDRLWLWVVETGRLVAPAFCQGDGVIACQARDRVAGLAEGDGWQCYRLARPPRCPSCPWFAAFGPRAMPLSLACALQFRDPQT